MMKQGLGNALDKKSREVLSGKVTVKQIWRKRGKSPAGIWKKSLPTEDTSSTKALGQEHISMFKEQLEGQHSWGGMIERKDKIRMEKYKGSDHANLYKPLMAKKNIDYILK